MLNRHEKLYTRIFENLRSTTENISLWLYKEGDFLESSIADSRVGVMDGEALFVRELPPSLANYIQDIDWDKTFGVGEGWY